MPLNNNVLDEYGMLTQNGKDVMQLALRDPATAEYMFAQMRKGVIEKINAAAYMLKNLQPISPTLSSQQLGQIIQAHVFSSAMTIIGVYSDFNALLDLEEMINKNALEPKTATEDVQEAVRFVRNNSGIIKYLRRDLADKARDLTKT
jgi:hypothetical protein